MWRLWRSVPTRKKDTTFSPSLLISFSPSLLSLFSLSLLSLLSLFSLFSVFSVFSLTLSLSRSLSRSLFLSLYLSLSLLLSIFSPFSPFSSFSFCESGCAYHGITDFVTNTLMKVQHVAVSENSVHNSFVPRTVIWTWRFVLSWQT